MCPGGYTKLCIEEKLVTEKSKTTKNLFAKSWLKKKQTTRRLFLPLTAMKMALPPSDWLTQVLQCVREDKGGRTPWEMAFLKVVSCQREKHKEISGTLCLKP